MERYQVYALTDEKGRIVDVTSSAFLVDPTGWVQIDEGAGDRYGHAQGRYFDTPLRDGRGIPRYKLVDGVPMERIREEIDADWVEPESVPSQEARIAALEEELRAAKILLGVE